MTERVSERTLEHLAAGALDEKTTAEVMARLEAEPGGVERLETLIRENEAFLEEHPPELVVPQIRARFEEDVSDYTIAARPEAVLDVKGTPSWFRPALVVVLLLLMIVGAFFWIGDDFFEGSDERTSRPQHAVAVKPNHGEVARIAGSETSEQERWDREPLTLSPWEMHPLERGEEVRRVVVENESIARANLVGRERSLRLYGIREGETAVEVFYADGASKRFLLRVRLPDDEHHRPFNVGLAPGEERFLGPEGVVRMSTQDETVARLDVNDDALILEAVGPGVTMVHFVTAELERPHAFRVHVGELLDPGRARLLLEAHREELRSCDEAGAGGRALMVAMISSKGSVTQAFAEEYSLSTTALDCVVTLVENWDLEGHDLQADGLIRFTVEF